MKPGDSFHYVAEEALGEKGENGRFRFAVNPATSLTTQLMAAAVTCGFKLAESCEFQHTIEQTDKGPLRRIEWMIDGKSRAHFRTVKNGVEEIEFPEFRARQSKPAALIRKGNQTAIIHPDLPDDKKRKLLSFFK